MANKDNTQVVVCSAAVAPSPPPSQPQPSDEIVRVLAAFLPKGQEDYVKICEEDQYYRYYVDIGPSKAVDQVYQSLYNRVDAIKNKYRGKLQALLTQLKAAQVTNTNEALHTTPSKIRGRKRSVPKSSSINKVIISRSKRTTNATTSSISNDTTSSSSRGKSLFRGTSSKGQTTDDSINPAAIEDKIVKPQSFADLMTELSIIDPNTTSESASSSKLVATTITKSKKKTKKNMASSFKKPFISNEESVVEKGTVIQEESNVSLQTGAGTAMKTRSRTRQENTLNSVTKTITKADSGFSEVATSSSKSSSKGKAQVAASPKSLTKPNRGQLNKRRSQSASNLNPTPSKGKFVDLAPAVSLNKLNTASTASSSSSNSPSRNVTPKRILSRRACAESPIMISTPSSVATRRQEIETSRQDRLIMSTEKSKKAEEKKKALLDLRINDMKTKREIRMGKFAENKKAIDHKKEEKLKAIVDHSVPVGVLPPGPTSAMTKAAARNAERRLKLAQMQLDHDKAEAEKAAAAIATTSKATGAKALKATKSAMNQPKKGVGKKQIQPKPVEVEQESTDVQPSENDVAALVMSPIAKLSGINGNINETFTAGPGPNPFTTPKADVSVPVGNSTLICAPGSLSAPADGDGTFSMQSAPPSTTPNKTNSTFNLSKALQSKLNSTNNYEMTPPPRERSYEHNYDISQYIDSDDEEKQAEHDAAQCGKYVPKWCLGRAFIDRVHDQFSLPPDELAQWTRRLFPKPTLPVPLEDMGLNVRESYVQRSSSVNWKTAAEIQLSLKNNQAQEQKL